jgi:predicted TIM-barrel fold metal-dependent hydrolase
VIRGYNDWLGEEYCAVAPDRLIGMGVIPITNVDDAIAEMKHCKKLGLKGILLGGLPNGKGYPTPETTVLGRRARSRHAGDRACQLYRTGPRANQPTMKYPKETRR